MREEKLLAEQKREKWPSFQYIDDVGFLSPLFSSLVAIPVYVKHNISFRDSSSLGRFEITVGPKQTMGKTIEGVTVASQMPRGVLNMSLTPSQGTHTFDPVTKVGEYTGGSSCPCSKQQELCSTPFCLVERRA